MNIKREVLVIYFLYIIESSYLLLYYMISQSHSFLDKKVLPDPTII